MDLLQRFKNFVANKNLFDASDRILLAVSGGKDSMLMAHLCLSAGYDIGIAHCNFQLRAEESDKDEALVRSFADRHNIPLYVAHFDTNEYANQQHISIQMAARDLRYDWFEQLRKQYD